ncbi:MAG TPA: FecR domain-containing protein [Chitinophagaceae bacterium]|jgi:ferric-dicitrate binding protein FerR (iron transport regulator)|nr:FecR domain-containing protein [Chitinophagaceae bacterium]
MLDQNSSSQNQFWGLLSKKLSKEANAEELQQLQTILLNNPDLHTQADMLTEMWQQGLINKSIGSEAVYMRHIMKHKDEFFVEENSAEINSDDIYEANPGFSHTLFSKKKFIILSFLAFIILTTGVVYLFTQKRDDKLPAEAGISSIVTKNGNRSKVVLPDGSQVWLNAGSNLDYNNSTFNKELREVSLNGEAYFDVTKNPDKPFIIHTKKMDIKVLGTVFNVRSYSNEKIAEAALIKGSIEVTLKDRKDQKIILKPNEKISISNEESKTEKKPEKITSVKADPVRIPQFEVNDLKPNPTYNIIGEIAWTQNKLYFEDETLEDIALRMERWFGKKVTIANESLKIVHYTGNFENETMEEVLSYLKLSKSFNFRIGNDNVVIY